MVHLSSPLPIIVFPGISLYPLPCVLVSLENVLKLEANDVQFLDRLLSSVVCAGVMQ